MLERSFLLERRRPGPCCSTSESPYPAGEPTLPTGTVVGALLGLGADAFSTSLLLRTGEVPALPGTAPLPSAAQSVCVPQKHCYFSTKRLSTPMEEGRGLSPK